MTQLSVVLGWWQLTSLHRKDGYVQLVIRLMALKFIWSPAVAPLGLGLARRMAATPCGAATAGLPNAAPLKVGGMAVGVWLAGESHNFVFTLQV